MAKYTGNFTAEAGKVLKNSSRICCRVYPDGSIIVVNGFVLYKMNPAEYAAIVQPVTHCDAGNWEIDSTGRHDTETDFSQIWSRSAEDAAAGAPLEWAPFARIDGKTEILGAYEPAAEAVYMYNRQYIRTIDATVTFRAKCATSPAVAFRAGEPFAMVLPVSQKTENAKRYIRAVMAWFNDPEAAAADQAPAGGNAELLQLVEKLEAERNDAEAAARDLSAQLAAKAAELEALQEAAREAAQQEAAQQEAAQAPSTGAQDVSAAVARFTALPGIIATVKGAQTAAPVIWLSGDVTAQAEEIKRQGGRWSAKREAYYFRIA